MLAASPVRVLQVLLLLSASSLTACHKDPSQKPQPVVVQKSPAELKQLTDSANQGLEGLKPLLSALDAKFSALHQQFDPIPPDLPEFGGTRGKFYAAEEGLGRMNAKIPWLSSQLAAAVKSRDGAQLEELSASITRSYEDVRQVNQVAMELLHEVRPFTKLAEEYEANQKAECETNMSGSTAVTVAEASKRLSAH